ncbi:MAG: AraC family transcriptional regulator [Victivallaceae bacterium]
MKNMLDAFKECPFRIFSPIYAKQAFHLHSMLINNGHQAVTTPTYCFDGMKRGRKEIFIWQYTLAGCGRLRFEGEEYKIDQGKAMLLLVPESHCYYFSPEDKYWEFIFVTINGFELIRLWLELRKMTVPVVSVPAESKCLNKAAAIYRTCCEGQLQTACEASAMAYDFTMHALQDLGRKEGVGSTPEFIPKITDYCMKHIGEDITVNDMCRISGYSKFHFSRLFHEYQGTSPKAFVTDLKMRLAIRLLQTERLSIKEIAVKCGFTDVSYFCKVFRSYHGVSPARFRNQQ